MKTIPLYWFRPEDYEGFRRLIPNDSHLPASFDQWELKANNQVAQMEALGVGVQKVLVDSTEFAAYCRATGLNPSIAILASFVFDRVK
jgi:hypothetical protein